MSLFKVFDVSGSALSAQSVRLNTIASNMSNAEVASSTAAAVYRPRHPVFQTIMNRLGSPGTAGVRVAGIVEANVDAKVRNMPGHEKADENGNVYFPGVNMVEELTDMMSAESNYRSNVELMSTVKQLMLRTLQMGRG
jgi:flagellar basal-body rod protein FlgC